MSESKSLRFIHVLSLKVNPPGDTSALHELYENWIASGEDWRKTKIYIKMTDNSGKIDSDARDWLCKTELVQKMGEAGASAMISFLEKHKPEQVRDHPDAPGIEDTKCFCLCGYPGYNDSSLDVDLWL